MTACRSCGVGSRGPVPDAKTVWLYREQLTQAGVIEALFETFDGYLKDQGYLAMGGQIIDGTSSVARARLQWTKKHGNFMRTLALPKEGVWADSA